MDLFNSYMTLPAELRSIIHHMCHMLIKYDIIRILTKCRTIGCENRRNCDQHVCSVHESSETDIIIPRRIMSQMFKGASMYEKNHCFIAGYDNPSCGYVPYARYECTFVRVVVSGDFKSDILNKKFPGIEWYIQNLNEQKKICEKEQAMCQK